MADRSAYDDLTADEQKLLDEGMADNTVPPAEDDDSNPIMPDQVAAEAGVKPEAAPAGDAAAPAAEAAPAKEPTEDEKLAAFMEQHKGKSPEELARLAFQQSQRANQAGFQARQTREAAEATTKRISDALGTIAERRKGLSAKKAEFDQRLAEDPDAATREVHDRLLTAEEQELATQEFTLKRDHMVNVASSVIPEFEKQAPQIAGFAAELNYTPEELGLMTDPRDMVTLWMASLTGRMMKAGIMDFNGNIDPAKLPKAVDNTDPRLRPTAAVIETLGGPAARTNGGGKTLEQQLGEIAAMDEAQMDAFEKANPGVLENLLRQAG